MSGLNVKLEKLGEYIGSNMSISSRTDEDGNFLLTITWFDTEGSVQTVDGKTIEEAVDKVLGHEDLLAQDYN